MPLEYKNLKPFLFTQTLVDIKGSAANSQVFYFNFSRNEGNHLGFFPPPLAMPLYCTSALRASKPYCARHLQ